MNHVFTLACVLATYHRSNQSTNRVATYSTTIKRELMAKQGTVLEERSLVVSGTHKVCTYSYSVKDPYHGTGISLSTRVTAQNKETKVTALRRMYILVFVSYIYGPQHLIELEIVLLKCIPYLAAIKMIFMRNL